jgi:hypothetical protein
MRLVPFAIVSLVLAACGSAPGKRSGVRPPSPQERREIVAVTKSDYAYESDPEPYRPSRIGVHLDFWHLHPKVVRTRISRSDPRFAITVVELRDAHGRRGPGTEVRLLRRIPKRFAGDPSWELLDESGTAFPLACTDATPTPIRDLSCPSPWSILGYSRPRIRLNTTVAMRIRSLNIHAVDWRHVILPGVACGATHPIRTGGGNDWGEAFVRSAVLPWWPAVAVGTGWDAVHYGKLDGDGRDEAVLDVYCNNAGGTAGGQLAFASVVYAVRGHMLRSIGVITPRQPLDSSASHVPLEFAQISRGKVIAHETWYGAYDGDCCGSGQARTIWTYTRGKLRVAHTTILQEPWASPLLIYDVVAEPGNQELTGDQTTKIVAAPGLRVAVSINNQGDVIKRHVKVKLTIRQALSMPIVQTRTIDEIKAWPLYPPTVSFGNLWPLQLGIRTTATIFIEEPGANPVRYRVIFTRG